tara:strand:+ start:7443 stop:7970 length:528 start_codon:yes stop_codon:yes gene_type:complete
MSTDHLDSTECELPDDCNEDTNILPLESITDNSEINQLTLSLFMNKDKYRKYIAQTDPTRNDINQDVFDDNKKYKKAILDLTARMIDSPNVQISNDVDQIFITYSKVLVQYLQIKERECTLNDYNGDNNEDMLFGTMENNTFDTDRQTQSLWGKERVIKHGGNISFYDKSLFNNR